MRYHDNKIYPGADPRKGAIASPPDGCWPKNRDARPIKSRFYQSQNAPKLAFLSSKSKIFWGGAQRPLPTPLGASILAPTALDLSAYGASASGASIHP